MRVALPWDGNMVFQHFGQSKMFAVYEIEDGKIKEIGMIDAGESGHGALAGVLAENGVSVLICGGIGAPAKDCLAKENIQCIAGATGWIKDVVAQYAAGTLENDPNVACDHHDSDGHSCGDAGHSCNNHGCH